MDLQNPLRLNIGNNIPLLQDSNIFNPNPLFKSKDFIHLMLKLKKFEKCIYHQENKKRQNRILLRIITKFQEAGQRRFMFRTLRGITKYRQNHPEQLRINIKGLRTSIKKYLNQDM